ncbi:Cupredoxin, partial [Trema orientale]
MAITSLSLLFLLLALTPLSQSAVFVSIDCGSSSDSYVDDNTIKWIGDKNLIQNGESHVVKDSNAVSHVMSTLRAFTTRKKNCYSIEAEKGGQVLLRVSFHYGNYDGKSSPPSFDLHADGNYWATVEFSSNDEVARYEAIYVVKGDHISVCVAQIHPNQFPFISAIEVRSLDSNMYGHVDSNYALLGRLTVAYGSNTSIRYPDDPYDRKWGPEISDNGLIRLTSDAPKIQVNLTDNPPEAVLRHAVTTSSTSDPLILDTQITSSVDAPIYINMYFSEVTQLDSNQTRSFVFTINGEVASKPIIPPYGDVLQLYLTNTTASEKTTFALVATKDSTLPPLINAMEVFYVAGPLTDGTYSKDVEALASLQEKYSVLQEWTGDPCLPSPFTWDWVNCSSEDTPRVTALYLDGFSLSGSIPDFSSLDALETIDLHNNSLTGSIPESLGNLPNLKELNLADNKLSGSIPTSLSKNSNLNLDVSGNPVLCSTSKLCTQKNKGTGSKSSSGSSVETK